MYVHFQTNTLLKTFFFLNKDYHFHNHGFSTDVSRDFTHTHSLNVWSSSGCERGSLAHLLTAEIHLTLLNEPPSQHPFTQQMGLGVGGAFTLSPGDGGKVITSAPIQTYRQNYAEWQHLLPCNHHLSTSTAQRQQWEYVYGVNKTRKTKWNEAHKRARNWQQRLHDWSAVLHESHVWLNINVIPWM